MLSLLLEQPFTLADALIALLVCLNPFALQNFDSKTSVHGVIASKVAIRNSPAGLMAALIGNSLEVAHNEAVCL